jgi:hypothetical protein
VNFTLWGAYHRIDRPLEPRRLAIHLRAESLPPLEVVVEADDLASGAPADFEVGRSGFSMKYALRFSDDRGRPCCLELTHPVHGRTLRDVTELSGDLTGHPDSGAERLPSRLGRAIVRLDYRDPGLLQFCLAMLRRRLFL